MYGVALYIVNDRSKPRVTDKSVIKEKFRRLIVGVKIRRESLLKVIADNKACVVCKCQWWSSNAVSYVCWPGRSTSQEELQQRTQARPLYALRTARSDSSTTSTSGSPSTTLSSKGSAPSAPTAQRLRSVRDVGRDCREPTVVSRATRGTGHKHR